MVRKWVSQKFQSAAIERRLVVAVGLRGIELTIVDIKGDLEADGRNFRLLTHTRTPSTSSISQPHLNHNTSTTTPQPQPQHINLNTSTSTYQPQHFNLNLNISTSTLQPQPSTFINQRGRGGRAGRWGGTGRDGAGRVAGWANGKGSGGRLK